MRFTSKFTTLILSLLLLNSLCAASTKTTSSCYELSEYVSVDYTDETKDSSSPDTKGFTAAQAYHKSGTFGLKIYNIAPLKQSFFTRVTSFPVLPQAPPEKAS